MVDITVGPPLIRTLQDSSFEFYFTGSRYFGYETETSDWDLFVQIPFGSIAGLYALLTKHGFRKESSNVEYTRTDIDPLNDAVEVWIHQGFNIHIQVVDNAAAKAKIQEVMKTVPGIQDMLRHLSKEDRKAIWKMGRAIFAAGKNYRGAL